MDIPVSDKSRIERELSKLLGIDINLCQPKSRIEALLLYILENGTEREQAITEDLASLTSVVREIAESISEEYDPELTYAEGVLVRHDGKLYRSNVAITVPEPWTPEHWDHVDLEDEITAIKQELASHEADNTIHVTSAEKENWNAKYDKPSAGIPKTDLSSGVQASLEKADSALQEHQSLAAYRTSSDQDVIDEAIKDDVSNIESLIPSQASDDNQLADKEFVNSSIGTNTAHYISDNGLPFTSVAALEAYTGTVTNNDYAFVTGTDESGNAYYDRYKATVSGSAISWAKEYRLNNSSFTAAQWASISSGITALLVSNLQSHLQNDEIHVTAQDKTNWNKKYFKPADGIPDSDLKEAHYTKSEADSLLDQKVSIQQETEDAGKVLGIGGDGRIVPVVENDADAVHYTSETKTDAEKAQARANINAAAPDGFYGNSGGVYQYSTNFLGKNAPTAVKDLVFRPTASVMSGTAWSAGSIGGDTATIERIKGKTLVWNQLVQNGNFESTSGWSAEYGSLSVSSNVGTFTFGSNPSTSARIEKNINFVEGHKIYLYGELYHTKQANFYISTGGTGAYGADSVRKAAEDVIVNNWNAVEGIVTASSTHILRFYNNSSGTYNTGETVLYRNVMAIDLTQMFGAGNEPATVKEFRAMFPLDYYDYNEGELISFNGTGLKTTGFNQWDGTYSNTNVYLRSNGEEESSNNYSVTDYIKILPNMDYCIKGISGSNPAICWYDTNKSFISGVNYQGANLKVVTSPANAMYARFSVYKTNASTTNFNLSWSGIRNGEYEPYWQRQLALPIAQYFPDGMKSAGTVYDELTKDKAVKRIGKVDLGTINWKYESAYDDFYDDSGTYGTVNTISPPYLKAVRITSHSQMKNVPNLTMAFQDNRNLFVKNTAYTDANSFKAAMSGVYLYYELAEPVITPISPELNLTYKVDDFGTEMLLPENTSEPVTTPMDADIVYQLDYEAQVRNMDALVAANAAVVAKQDASDSRLNTTDKTVVGAINELKGAFGDYVKIIKLEDDAETLSEIKARLDAINVAGEHVFFDTVALNYPLYLCAISIVEENGALTSYRVNDLVSGKVSLGAYDGTKTIGQILSEAVDDFVTITVTCNTVDGATVTGQTVTLRNGSAEDAPIARQATYNGQPVTFVVPKDFVYFISASDTLSGHFNPNKVTGIAIHDTSVIITYKDVTSLQTAADIQAALDAEADLTAVVGSQITCAKNNTTLTWDIADYDSTAHEVTLLLHDTLPDQLVFEPSQALAYFENGLAAGDYKFLHSGKTYYLTLTTAIPAGGQLKASTTAFTTYESQDSSASLESGVVSETEIAGATSLGTTASGTLNHMDRVNYGSNNLKESALQWWLNTDAPASTLVPRTNKFSRAYRYSVAGLLNGLDPAFLACIADTVWKCATNQVYEAPSSMGGTVEKSTPYTITAKFCLASRKEIFGDSDGTPDGSTQFDLYVGATATDRKKYYNGSVRYWWLRSASPGGANYERVVYPGGSVSSLGAASSYGVVPACKIKKST